MHGNDERVGVEVLKQGTESILRTLVSVAGMHRASPNPSHRQSMGVDKLWPA